MQLHTDYFGVNSHTTEGTHNFDSSKGGTNRLATVFMCVGSVLRAFQKHGDRRAVTLGSALVDAAWALARWRGVWFALSLAWRGLLAWPRD